ncbi:MAG: hypothetical protein RLZZ03_1713, partial [Pseudomonadota bacterium]
MKLPLTSTLALAAAMLAIGVQAQPA